MKIILFIVTGLIILNSGWSYSKPTSVEQVNLMTPIKETNFASQITSPQAIFPTPPNQFMPPSGQVIISPFQIVMPTAQISGEPLVQVVKPVPIPSQIVQIAKPSVQTAKPPAQIPNPIVQTAKPTTHFPTPKAPSPMPATQTTTHPVRNPTVVNQKKAPIPDEGVCIPPAQNGDYAIGVDDILTIDVLQPEKIENNVTVSPDGNISFPYIGSVPVKGRSLSEVEQDIQIRLANGYLRYPTVVVYLKESRSRRFFVYGEVNRPGPYHLEENTTVLRAISMAEGFTRFGSASRVKLLRLKKNNLGYETIPINIKAVMEGDSDEDIILKPGDMVVVSEGVF